MSYLKILLMISAFLLLPVVAKGQNSILHVTSINSGGGRSASTSFKLSLTAGEPLVDSITSTSFSFEQGFWYQHNAIQNIYRNAFMVTDGWNLISVGKDVPDYRKNVLFPTAVSPAFAYSAGYIKLDTLKIGVGYWMKFAGAQPIVYTGIPLTSDTIDVVEKWNLIGGIGCPVPTVSIISVGTTITSPYYGYNGNYFIATTLEPGNAYWVKCAGPGKLILNCSEGNTSIIK